MKRWIAVLMIAVLAVGLLAGCSSAPQEEEGAMVDTYVEGEKHTPSEDAPDKDETPQDTPADTQPDVTPDTTPDGTPDETPDEQPNETPETPKEETPKEETPNEEPSDDGEENEDKPTLEGTDPANALKIVAYNIRYADDGGGKNIADRAPNFKALMEQKQPDIMALSEATSKWIEYLENNMVGPKYTMLYTYRAENDKEAQPLLFDHTKFDLLDNGYFWLSETPDVASVGWGGGHYRGVTWAKLKVKATGKVFLYYCTHMSGSDLAVTNSARLIYKHAIDRGGFKDLPVFLSGDFNTEPWSIGYTELITNFVDVNDFLGFDETYTNGGYTEGDKGGNHIIDYVMCSPDNVVPTHYEVLPHMKNGGFISDHKGLYVEATLK